MLPVAVMTIVVSLALLVAVPIAVEWQIGRIRSERIGRVDVAEREVNELAFTLAREMALLRGFLFDGDTLLLRSYSAMRDHEENVVSILGGLDPLLAPPLSGLWRETRVAMTRWHGVADRDVRVLSQGTAPEPTPAQAFGRSQYEDALATINELREALALSRRDALEELQQAERFGLGATSGLAVLAALATALVVWLGRRVRRYANRVRDALAETLHANESRARLMRGVAHDLRNPVNAVTLSAQMLEEGLHGPLSSDQQSVVQRIQTAAGRVMELLEDLQELSQAESGQLRLDFERVDLATLLRTIGEAQREVATSAGIEVRLDVPSELTVTADASRVRRIVDNLVGNAIKFTPVGGVVSVQASRTDTGPNEQVEPWVAVQISDTGPGIPASESDRVFEEFLRLAGRDKGQPGSGIGLAISRQLARLMGGEITLESEEGRGATFILWLPFTETASASQVAGEASLPRAGL